MCHKAPFSENISTTKYYRRSRKVCRPKPGPETTLAASRTADRVNEASGELRKANEALVQKEVRRANLQTLAAERMVPEVKPPTGAKPFARVVVVIGERICVPEDEGNAEAQRERLQCVLEELRKESDKLAGRTHNE